MEKKAKKKARSRTLYTVEFKEAAVRRMEAGENASELARELSVRRKLLYYWRSQVRQGRKMNVLGPRRNRQVVVAATEQDRIAELERLVGRQQLELSFFRGALRRVEALTQQPSGAGATPYLPKSGK